MAEMTAAELEALGIVLPPTEDELPCDDGMPMETQRHALQMQLLIDPLRRLFRADRTDAYVGGNMFLYFSPEQVCHQDFRGPDFFAVLGVPKRERMSWVVWQKGKGPDVVIELLSESTTAQDKGEENRYRPRRGTPRHQEDASYQRGGVQGSIASCFTQPHPSSGGRLKQTCSSTAPAAPQQAVLIHRIGGLFALFDARFQ